GVQMAGLWDAPTQLPRHRHRAGQCQRPDPRDRPAEVITPDRPRYGVAAPRVPGCRVGVGVGELLPPACAAPPRPKVVPAGTSWTAVASEEASRVTSTSSPTCTSASVPGSVLRTAVCGFSVSVTDWPFAERTVIEVGVMVST